MALCQRGNLDLAGQAIGRRQRTLCATTHSLGPRPSYAGPHLCARGRSKLLFIKGYARASLVGYIDTGHLPQSIQYPQLNAVYYISGLGKLVKLSAYNKVASFGLRK